MRDVILGITAGGMVAAIFAAILAICATADANTKYEALENATLQEIKKMMMRVERYKEITNAAAEKQREIADKQRTLQAQIDNLYHEYDEVRRWGARINFELDKLNRNRKGGGQKHEQQR